MSPPYRPRPLRKDNVPQLFKSSKTLVFSETARPSTLAPNIRSISWSPTGAMIAHSTSVNIRAWNPERPDVKASAEMKDGPRGGAHANAVEKVVFNPCIDAVLASTGLDSMLKVWDVRLPGMAVAGTSIGTNANSGGGAGTTAVVGGGMKGGVNGKAGEYKLKDQGLFLTWHPNGNEVLVGRRDDVVQAVDLRRPDVVMDIHHTNSSSSNVIPTYDLTPTDRTPVKDKGSFNAMSFSHSGRELFATTADGPIKILDYPSMTSVHELHANTGSTYAVRLSPTGNYLAAGGSDSMITLWDTTSWLCSHMLTHHTYSIRDLSFSFDGAYLVVGSSTDNPKDKDGERGLCVYHVDTGDVVHTVETVNVPTWVAWHPFRYAIAYAGDPGGLKIVGSLSGL